MTTQRLARNELARTRIGQVAGLVEHVVSFAEARQRATELYQQAEAPPRDSEQRILEETFEIALCSGGQPRILDACAAVLARMGHFPSIDALQRQFSKWTPHLPLRLQFDAGARILALSPHGDTDSPYTPFQADLYDALVSENSASVSSPTSSGKSFVLARILYDLAAKQGKNVAYVVPTRALIREVSGRIRRYLRSKDRANPIRTSPVPLPGSQQSAGHIYVLTQERLLALLAEGPQKIHFDVLMVDEAHEVQQQTSRGILLEGAIELTRRMFPNVRLLFAAPAIPNPAYMLTLTQLPPITGIGHRDTRSPVVHNYFEVRIREETEIVLHGAGQTFSMAKVSLLPDTDELAAWTAHNIHQAGSTTLVYCRGPASAENAADWLMENSADGHPKDDEVEALAKFVETDIHKKHPLAGMLRKRIATHYGDMPPVVRVRIEELAAAGKLDYVCCTSTLLSGVNLPCRNLVMCDPRKGAGVGTPLDDAEIRNLAGRAGRVDSDLVGNVWIVSTPTIIARIPSETLPPIISGFQKELQAGAPALADIDRAESQAQEKMAYASAFAARAFDLRERGVSLVAAARENNPPAVELLAADNRIQVMQAEVKPNVPDWIIRKHPGISPTIIRGLLNDMLTEVPLEKLRKWIPTSGRIHPEWEDDDQADIAPSASKYNKCRQHLGKVNKYLARHFKEGMYTWPPDVKTAGDHPATWRLVAIAALWVNGIPLKWILHQSVQIAAEKEGKLALAEQPLFVREKVRNTIETIEDDIRFRMAQRWRLVEDLLTHIFTEVHPEPETLAPMIQLHMWLEFGTISQEALDIMGLGFSRGATQYIRKAMKQDGVAVAPDAANVIDWLNGLTEMRIRNWQMPPELWLEMCLVSGRNPKEVRWTSPAGTV